MRAIYHRQERTMGTNTICTFLHVFHLVDTQLLSSFHVADCLFPAKKSQSKNYGAKLSLFYTLPSFKSFQSS